MPLLSMDFAAAERLGLEFAEDFCLLNDIGWAEHDEREAFGLTMQPHDLMELLRRLHDEAARVLIEHGTEAEASRRDVDTDRRFQIGHETCEKVVADLDPPRSAG